MLVLSRKPGEKVIIANTITLTVLGVTGNHVRVGIDAPSHVPILRAELAIGERGSMGSEDRLEIDVAAPLDSSRATAATIG